MQSNYKEITLEYTTILEYCGCFFVILGFCYFLFMAKSYDPVPFLIFKKNNKTTTCTEIREYDRQAADIAKLRNIAFSV